MTGVHLVKRRLTASNRMDTREGWRDCEGGERGCWLWCAWQSAAAAAAGNLTTSQPIPGVYLEPSPKQRKYLVSDMLWKAKRAKEVKDRLDGVPEASLANYRCRIVFRTNSWVKSVLPDAWCFPYLCLIFSTDTLGSTCKPWALYILSTHDGKCTASSLNLR